MDGPLTPAGSAARRAEALAWAEAISAAGERIEDDLGFEEEAICCYIVAGRLLERAGEYREGVA